MPSLVQALRELLEARARRRRVVVWYDPGGSLGPIAHRAVPEGVQLLTLEGSYLSLRARFEEQDPRLEKSWIIYIPEGRRHPSWLRDLEFAGDLVELGLDGLVAEAFDLPTTPRLRGHLAGRPGRTLAGRWDELVPERPSVLDLERALVAAALELGADARLKEIVTEYVSRAEAPEPLVRLDLHPELRHVLEVEGGLAGLPEGEVPQQRVAAALLLSEAVIRGRIEGSAFGDALPEAGRRPQWCAWAEDWMRRADDHSFRAWSERIARLYRVRDHFEGGEVAEVEAFAEVDDVLLATAEGLEAKGDRAELRAIAERRLRSYWARTSEERGEPLPWAAVLAALDLLEGVEAASRELAGRETWSLGDLLSAYATDDGWWRLDDAYRRLEATWSRLPQGLAARLGVPAARAYGHFLDLVGTASARALEVAPTWFADGWESQRAVVARFLDDGVDAAVVLADALRYDLSRLLADRLQEKGVEVEIVPTLADLPSVTQVGMAAVQCPAWEEREVAVERGTFFPKLGESLLRSREDRLAHLRTRYPAAAAVELDTVQQARSIPRASPLVVYASAVDEQGDSLPQIGLDLFERLVWAIADGVMKLLDVGYRRVVIIPDHGFVLLPRQYEVRTVDAGAVGGGTARGRRYVIGGPADSEAMVRVPLDRLGWRGQGAATFPRGLSVVSLPGQLPRFFHGGPMPQETAVLSLVCRRPESAASPVGVRLVRPEHIDTTRPRFELEGEAEALLTAPRRVRVVIRLDDRVVAESEAIEIRAGERSEVGVRLERYGRHIEVLVEDVETREVVATRVLPVELPRGYEEFDV